MVRQVFVPINNDIPFKLPDAFIGKEVELTVLLKSEINSEIDKKKYEGIMASHSSFAREWLNDAEEEAWKDYQ